MSSYDGMIRQLAEAHDLTLVEARSRFDAVIAVLAEGIGAGVGRTAIPRFGAFVVRERPASKGKNPRTGAPIDIAAKRIVSFKAAAALSEQLNPAAPPPPTKR